jgi:hypothetical protein
MNFIKRLDQIGISPSLYVYSESRYKTLFGSFLTFSIYISVTVLSFILLVNYFENKELNILNYRETKNISKGSIIPYMMFKLSDVAFIDIDPKIADMVFTKWTYNNSNNAEIEIVNIEQCSIEKHFNNSDIYKELLNFDLSLYYCPNLTSFPINDNPQLVVYYNIYNRECLNTTANGNHCFPREEIQKQLKNSNIYFTYVLPSNIVDHYNKSTPIHEAYLQKHSVISYDMIYSDTIEFKQLIYESDYGFAFDDIIRFEGFMYDDIQSYRDAFLQGKQFYIPNTFSHMQISMNSDYAELYKRTYPKIQSIMANIGGILKLITFIAKLISEYYTSNMMFIDLSNEIIHFEDSEKATTLQNLNDTQPKLNNIVKTVNSLSNVNLKRKKISFWEAFIPARFVNKKSIRCEIKNIEDIIKKRLSVDYLLKELSDLDKVKRILLNRKQFLMLSKLRNMTIKEFSFMTKERETISNINYEQLNNSEVISHNNIEDRILCFHDSLFEKISI